MPPPPPQSSTPPMATRVHEHEPQTPLECASALHAQVLRWLDEDDRAREVFVDYLREKRGVRLRPQARGCHVITVDQAALMQVMPRVFTGARLIHRVPHLGKLLRSANVHVRFYPTRGKDERELFEEAAPSWLIYRKVRGYKLDSMAMVAMVYRMDDDDAQQGEDFDLFAFAMPLHTLDGGKLALHIADDLCIEVGYVSRKQRQLALVEPPTEGPYELTDHYETI